MAYASRFGRGYLTDAPVNRHDKVLGRFPQVGTGSLTVASETAYAYYVGRAGTALSSIDVGVYVHGVAAATTGWAEVAIAKGSFTLLAANLNLTMLGYASIDTEVKAAATASYGKTIASISIVPEDDLWVVVAASYDTTQASFRIVNGDGERQGLSRRRASCRPSTNLNTALAFAYTAAQTVPIMWAQLP